MTSLKISDASYYADANYYSGALLSSKKPINYIDLAPKPLIVQIPLIEYFERVKRLKADRWQRDFCERLQTAATNRHTQRTWELYHAEGQLGKTAILSQAYPAWLFGHDPLYRFALAMYNQTRSELHSAVVIQILQSPIHKDIFPDKNGRLFGSSDAAARVSKTGWMTTARRELNDGQLSFNPVGLQSGLTGAGFDHLSIDDPYKEAKEAFSEITRLNLTNFWLFTVLSRAGLHSNIAGMFHRYHVQDLAGYLLDTGDFNYIRYATIADGDYIHEETGQRFADPLGRTTGEYICPERRSPEYYAKARKNNRVWVSMYQGRPSAEAGEFFNIGKLKIISSDIALERRAECAVMVRAWDNAATSEGGAYSVGVLMGMGTGGRITVFDVVREQLDSAQRFQKQKATAEKDGAVVPIRIPQDPGSAGKDTAWQTVQTLQGYSVIARPVSGSKEDRARNASAAVNSGEVGFIEADWNKACKNELRDFPLSEYKDFVDAFSDGYNYLYEMLIKGSLITNYRPQRNLFPYSVFAEVFPVINGDDQQVLLKIPKAFTIYVGIKISADASYPSSAIIVARASENSGLKETLFVVAEYKAHDGNYQRLFDWLDGVLKNYIESPDYNNTTIWLHPDSAHFQQTILEKLKVNVAVFGADKETGYAELNWYFLSTSRSHPATQLENASRMYLLIDDGQFEAATDTQGLPFLRQELATCGYNDKGEPSATSSVLDCLRMCVAEFATHSTVLTHSERYAQRLQAMLPVEMQQSSRSGHHIPGLDPAIAPDITLQMNELFLRKQLREEGEWLPETPFDEEADPVPDISGGW